MQEKRIWFLIGDLLDYLNDLSNLGKNHGDLQPEYVMFTPDHQTKVFNPLLFTEFSNAYKYRLANENYKSAYAPELLA